MIFCLSEKFTWLLYRYDRTRARIILIATGLSLKSSTKSSNSGIAIFEKQLIIEKDTNFAAGVPISSAICEKVDLNSLLPTALITFENTNKQKFKEVSSKKESIFLIISLLDAPSFLLLITSSTTCSLSDSIIAPK